MAKRSKSGLKRRRQSEKRRVQNQGVLSRVRTMVKQATAATLGEAIAAIDKAVAAGVLQKNTAARRKSRLIKRLRRTAAPQK